MKNPFVRYVFLDPLEGYDKKAICTVSVKINDEEFRIPLFILDKVTVNGTKGLLLSVKINYDAKNADVFFLDRYMEVVKKTCDTGWNPLEDSIRPDQGEFLEHFVRLRYKNVLLKEAKELEGKAYELQEKIRKT